MSVEGSLAAIMEEYKNKSYEEIAEDLQKIPFFMTELDEDAENNEQLAALRDLAYDGTKDEIAENFRQQGNDCYRTKQYPQAIEYYSKAIEQDCQIPRIEIACYGNRAQCNLELKNYRKCVNDCVKVLEIDHDNLKAWYRSGKAFFQLGRYDECLTCCAHGLSVDKTNEGILAIQEQALRRKAERAQAEEKRKQREAEKEQEKRVFQLALDAREITCRFTERFEDKRKTTGDLKASLEDPKDHLSQLIVPLMVLYPVSLESDIIQQISELSTVNEVVEQLFEQPPPWANKFPSHKLGNLDVFAPTSSGGLAKIGLKSTISKILGTTKPDVTMVDGMCRLYVVPKDETAKFLGSWKKQELHD